MCRHNEEDLLVSSPEEECHEKYAIFIPEGTGYLHCRYLGLGSEGAAHIVRSIVDNQDYVRKKLKPTHGAAKHKTDGVRNPEVSLYRPHPHIPRLLDHGDYFVLPEGHPRHDEFRSSFLIFTWSNGGNLSRLYGILERERVLAPEALVLQLLDHLIGTLIFLHNGSPGVCGVVHRDAMGDNVFLHFVTEDTKMPVIMLGDFGGARAISDSVWEDSEDLGTRRLKAWSTFDGEIAAYNAMIESGEGTDKQDPASHMRQAAEMLWDIKSVQELTTRAFEGKGQGDNPQVRTTLSAEAVEAVVQFQQALSNNDYNAAVAIYPQIHKLAEDAREKTNLYPDFQWTRHNRYRDDLPPGQPSLPNFPWQRYTPIEPQALATLDLPFPHEWQYTGTMPRIRLFNSRLELLQSTSNVPGPWRIARICPETLKITAVERFSYAFGVPTFEDRWADGRAPQPADFDYREHLEIKEEFIKDEADRIGMNAVLNQIEQIESDPKNAEDRNDLTKLDPDWCGENGRLSKQVRLTRLAKPVVAEPMTEAAAPDALKQDATTPIGCSAPSTEHPPPDHTKTTPTGSPTPSTGDPPAPATAAAPAGNPAPAAGQPPPRKRQRRDYGPPNVRTRAMATAGKRQTRSMTKAALEKAKKGR